MSLDENLFTLHFTQNKANPNVIDLMDPSGTAHYRRHRIPGQTYKVEVYDPMSEALLAAAMGPAASSKHKTLELYNPTIAIELKYTGTLAFRWSFKWEEYDYEWKREECYMVRKPDPPVLVAVTREPAGKIKTTTMQILDYNLNRFEINDRKGLEIVIITALLTFQDFNEPNSSEPAAKGRKVSDSRGVTTANLPPRVATSPMIELGPPPPPPPKPAPKKGIDRIAEIQAMRGEINEVVVEDEGVVPDYAQYCFNLLQDDAMLFIMVKSASAEQVPKLLQVVEEAKRLRHKNGLGDDELHQYVLYDTERQKGPRIINLDDDNHNRNKDKYKPPSSLIVHLSKIPMPELQPKAHQNERRGKEESRREADRKQYSDGENASSSLSVPKSNFLARRKASSSSLAQTNQPHSHSPSANSEPSPPYPIVAGSSNQHPSYPHKVKSSRSVPNTHVHYDGRSTSPVPPPPQPQPSQRPTVTSLFDILRR
ncbi:hypothetical protein AX15_002154 [Amanita polypyramis BW_CC]|nr:hypothetical protein AX15_002154 [Amanita polypyramis BW_CC]